MKTSQQKRSSTVIALLAFPQRENRRRISFSRNIYEKIVGLWSERNGMVKKNFTKKLPEAVQSITNKNNVRGMFSNFQQSSVAQEIGTFYASSENDSKLKFHFLTSGQKFREKDSNYRKSPKVCRKINFFCNAKKW